MKKNSLSTTGLSMSQAQSISNLCHQRALEIQSALSGVNNYEKRLTIGSETYVETQGKKLPLNTVDLILEKSRLHSAQSFLMENLKAKEAMLAELRSKQYERSEHPVKYPDLLEVQLFYNVGEDWGWNQLSVAEIAEYLEAESYAAHIGQFIHKGSVLDSLRRELPTIKTLEWITVKEGEKTPLKVNIHHTSEYLLELHEELAGLHRKHEQRVNYFKAKVNNLVTEENARIARVNGDESATVTATNAKLMVDYRIAMEAFENKQQELKQKFEADRQQAIKETAALRISVDPRFQDVIDIFLAKLD